MHGYPATPRPPTTVGRSCMSANHASIIRVAAPVVPITAHDTCMNLVFGFVVTVTEYSVKSVLTGVDTPISVSNYSSLRTISFSPKYSHTINYIGSSQNNQTK